MQVTDVQEESADEREQRMRSAQHVSTTFGQHHVPALEVSPKCGLQDWCKVALALVKSRFNEELID